MSNKVLKLKIQKTIKEYDFLKSEYNYINEISNVADVEFLDAIGDYLKERPALKDIYDSKVKKTREENFEKLKKQSENVRKKQDDNNKKEKESNDEASGSTQDGETEEVVIEELPKKKSKKSKHLYRQIVKLTHPDKVDDKKLNEIYIRATDSYNEDDAASLYAICDEIGIEFGVNEDDLMFFEQNIHRIKGEINLMKGTFAYDWSQASDDKKKESLILRFIKAKIS